MRVGQTETHTRGKIGAGGELETGTRLSGLKVELGPNQEIPLGICQVDQDGEDMELDGPGTSQLTYAFDHIDMLSNDDCDQGS